MAYCEPFKLVKLKVAITFDIPLAQFTENKLELTALH
jgi:hypothetical protein